MMMRPAAMTMIVVAAMEADTHANAADMNADANAGRSRCRAEQAQGENGDDQLFHDNSFW
jgi:hypothetical protein